MARVSSSQKFRLFSRWFDLTHHKGRGGSALFDKRACFAAWYLVLLSDGSFGKHTPLEEEIVVDQEVSLYRVKALSREGVFVDWKALADRVSGARLTQLYKTHCAIMLPKESIVALDEILAKEYRSVRRAPMEKERGIRPPVREARIWRW